MFNLLTYQSADTYYEIACNAVSAPGVFIIVDDACLSYDKETMFARKGSNNISTVICDVLIKIFVEEHTQSNNAENKSLLLSLEMSVQVLTDHHAYSCKLLLEKAPFPAKLCCCSTWGGGSTVQAMRGGKVKV